MVYSLHIYVDNFIIMTIKKLLDLKMSADKEIDNTKFLFTFTKNILNSDESIRWVGITDQSGNIINERYREG